MSVGGSVAPKFASDEPDGSGGGGEMTRFRAPDTAVLGMPVVTRKTPRPTWVKAGAAVVRQRRPWRTGLGARPNNQFRGRPNWYWARKRSLRIKPRILCPAPAHRNGPAGLESVRPDQLWTFNLASGTVLTLTGLSPLACCHPITASDQSIVQSPPLPFPTRQGSDRCAGTAVSGN